MKTNQEMIRKMGMFNVIQRTSDGYFNATHLLRQWNDTYSTEQRRIDKFWDCTHLDKLMSEIAENELNFKSPNFGELKKCPFAYLQGQEKWRHMDAPYLIYQICHVSESTFRVSCIEICC